MVFEIRDSGGLGSWVSFCSETYARDGRIKNLPKIYRLVVVGGDLREKGKKTGRSRLRE